MAMENKGFDVLWKKASTFRRVTPRLKGLLKRVYEESLRRPSDASAVKASLEDLLVLLVSAEGRTDANCTVTDYFFSATEGWEGTRDHLPADLQSILSDLGGALHDSVHAPAIARNFESLPEQLLERLRRI